MKKNRVYRKGWINMVCIMADEEYACMCPLEAHRNDSGYRIHFKCEIYSQKAKAAEFEEIGYIESPNLVLHKKVNGHAN